MITLRQLEIFLAVARVEHVTAAAAAVHLSQSAVSAALGGLAARRGGPLFDRAGRRLVLNDRGRRLQAEAADLLQRARDLMHHFLATDVIAGRLRVGASSTIGMYLLPEQIAAFVTAEPDVTIDLEVGNTEAIEAKVVARDLDLGFIEGPPRDPHVAATSFRDDELCVFVAATHPLARRRRLALAALQHERWILREPGSGTRAVFEAALRQLDVPLPVGLQLGHTEAVKEGVRAGLGIGCLSTLAVRRELASGLFKALRVPGLDLRRRLWCITRQGSYANAAQRAFLGHLKAMTPAAGGAGRPPRQLK
jgi:DNA-binding transcriptional LysR family regulator